MTRSELIAVVEAAGFARPLDAAGTRTLLRAAAAQIALLADPAPTSVTVLTHLEEALTALHGRRIHAKNERAADVASSSAEYTEDEHIVLEAYLGLRAAYEARARELEDAAKVAQDAATAAQEPQPGETSSDHVRRLSVAQNLASIAKYDLDGTRMRAAQCRDGIHRITVTSDMSAETAGPPLAARVLEVGMAEHAAGGNELLRKMGENPSTPVAIIRQLVALGDDAITLPAIRAHGFKDDLALTTELADALAGLIERPAHRWQGDLLRPELVRLVDYAQQVASLEGSPFDRSRWPAIHVDRDSAPQRTPGGPRVHV